MNKKSFKESLEEAKDKEVLDYIRKMAMPNDPKYILQVEIENDKGYDMVYDMGSNNVPPFDKIESGDGILELFYALYEEACRALTMIKGLGYNVLMLETTEK